MRRRSIIALCLLGHIMTTMLLAACVIGWEIAGDYQRPDKIHMTLNFSMGGEEALAIEMIQIGGTLYVLDPDIGDWVTSEEYEADDSGMMIPEFGGFGDSIIQMISAFQVSEILASEEVGGIPCYRLKGTIDPANMKAIGMDSSNYKYDAMEAEIWIGKSDFLARRLMATGIFDSETESNSLSMERANFSFSYEFSRFNEPVTIETPETN